MTQVNIYDTAHQLQSDLRQLPAYQSLKEAYENIQSNEASKKLFDEFREKSSQLHQQASIGNEPSEEEMNSLQDMASEVAKDELIQKLMTAEQQLNLTMEDLNKIITEPLNELYSN